MDAMPSEEPWVSKLPVEKGPSEENGFTDTALVASTFDYLTGSIDASLKTTATGFDSKILPDFLGGGLNGSRNSNALDAAMAVGQPWLVSPISDAINNGDVITGDQFSLAVDSSVAASLSSNDSFIRSASNLSHYLPFVGYGAAAVEVSADVMNNPGNPKGQLLASSTAVAVGEGIEYGAFAAGAGVTAAALTFAGVAITAPVSLVAIGLIGLGSAIAAGFTYSDEYFTRDIGESPSSKLKAVIENNVKFQPTTPNDNFRVGMSPALMSTL
jgi:hypothetical protein